MAHKLHLHIIRNEYIFTFICVLNKTREYAGKLGDKYGFFREYPTPDTPYSNPQSLIRAYYKCHNQWQGKQSQI